MSDFIGIDVAGEDVLAAALNKLPDAARDEVVDEVSKYLIDVLKTTQPSYRYVSRKSAYGVTFFTDKQRRWFFAALKSGSLQLPYRRTQTYRNAWRQEGGGYRSIIVNETPYAAYLQDDGGQSRHAAKIGWKKLGAVVKERAERVNEKARGAIKRAMKKVGL